MTKKERIQRMNTKELAKFIYGVQVTGDWCSKEHCPRYLHIGCRSCNETNCIDAIGHWLETKEGNKNAGRILEEYEESLTFEIDREINPLFKEFIEKNKGKEGVSEKDIYELKGYFKGLRTAKEILDRKKNERVPDTEF